MNDTGHSVQVSCVFWAIKYIYLYTGCGVGVISSGLYKNERNVCTLCIISVYFCIVIYNESSLHVCKHGRYVRVQGMPICPKYGDMCVRASACLRPPGQPAQSSVALQLTAVQRGCGEEGCGLPLPPMLSRERISAEYVCGSWGEPPQGPLCQG